MDRRKVEIADEIALGAWKRAVLLRRLVRSGDPYTQAVCDAIAGSIEEAREYLLRALHGKEKTGLARLHAPDTLLAADASTIRRAYGYSAQDVVGMILLAHGEGARGMTPRKLQAIEAGRESCPAWLVEFLNRLYGHRCAPLALEGGGEMRRLVVPEPSRRAASA